jgi:hypothetical protein
LQSGFARKKFATAAIIAGLHALAGQAYAVDLSLPITGNLLGSVVDIAGTPQMGATVQLFNKERRLIAKTSTALDGRFAFAGLPVDLYSVRVSLTSFLPVSRDQVAIKAGLDSILQIHLATLFSSIEVGYVLPTAAMTDDWKWVLRSSPATRPITRFLPDEEAAQSSGRSLRPRIFSGTHAMLSVSGGDGGLIDSDSAQADLGTGFAVSTNILGKNQIQIGGAVGETATVGPAAMGFCAIYSRDQDGGLGNPPEVTLTVSQLGRVGAQVPGGQNSSTSSGFDGSFPALRTMSLSVYNVSDPVDDVHIEYGMTGESVDYLQHTSRISPFARVTVSAGKTGDVIVAFSDGARPDELTAHQQYEAVEQKADESDDNDLASTVNTLARLPQISNRDGVLKLQRTENYEVGYKKTAGSRTYSVSAFYEDVSNGRINVAGDVSLLNPSDLLTDGLSTTSTLNVGNYRRAGYMASVSQYVNDSVEVALAYGRMGGFAVNANGSPESWRTEQNFLDQGNHNVANANIRVRAPRVGTRLIASYGWMDGGSVIPLHVFTTQSTYVTPGLNVTVRQPLPSLFGMPGRLEVTAELRNLLAQGYLPLQDGSGRTLLLVQAPRAVRGGLNFIF